LPRLRSEESPGREAPIANALLDAYKRGVQAQVILDQRQLSEKYSSADFLANQGVPTMIGANHTISSNKVMIIDGETVIMGSFNFTKATQEKNAENLLIIRDPALAAQYTQLGSLSATSPAIRRERDT
jgi:phosphatidylserine/phosphatidylglycerophosphate/cardiolipin synthase-like enzyme